MSPRYFVQPEFSYRHKQTLWAVCDRQRSISFVRLLPTVVKFYKRQSAAERDAARRNQGE